MKKEQSAEPRQRPRWYRYSLWAFFIFVLLPVDGFFWCPMLHRKGTAELMVLTVVGLATLYLILRFVLALLHRVPFQFSLRSLLLFTLVVALSFSWLGVGIRRANMQKEAIEALHKHNGIKELVSPRYDASGMVMYTEDYYYVGMMGIGPGRREPVFPQWIENLLGTDFFDTVDIVTLDGLEMTDADLEHINKIRNLRILRLVNTSVTDAGHEKLQKELPGLFITRR